MAESYLDLKANGFQSVDFYLTKSCNKTCHYCQSWTLEMRNLEVDMDFLRHTLECFKGNKTIIQLLGGEPALVKNLNEVIAMIQEYPEFRVTVLSNSLIRIKYPNIVEDQSIYYLEHLVLDFHEDRIEKLGPKSFDFFPENDLNNYNIVIMTPGYYEYRKNFKLNYIDHKNTMLKQYNSRSPTFSILEQAPLLTRQICSKFPLVPVIDFEERKLRHCSKKINESKRYEITKENINKLFDYTLFEFEDYCDKCTEILPENVGKTQEQILHIMETL